MNRYTSKYNHLKEIRRREEVRASIARKINRKNDPKYIFYMQLKTSICTFIIFSILTIIISMSRSSIASAKTDTTKERTKYYTTIEIQKGDTLTSIAKEYSSSEYKNLDEYIEEIMSINNLKDDKITSGCYLKVSYYK